MACTVIAMMMMSSPMSRHMENQHKTINHWTRATHASSPFCLCIQILNKGEQNDYGQKGKQVRNPLQIARKYLYPLQTIADILLIADLA